MEADLRFQMMWSDPSNANFIPDCDLMNPAAQNLQSRGGDICGVMSNTNFGQNILTNNFAPMDRTPSARSALLDVFDVVVESSKVGIRKPDPAIYALACETLDVAPAECVFLDDLGVNLKPARAMGMTTIKVTDPASALAELESVVGADLRG